MDIPSKNWIERRRGGWRPRVQRAVVTSTTKCGGGVLWIDGRSGAHELTAPALSRWRTMRLVGPEPPGWVKAGDLYFARDSKILTVAQVDAVKPGWIAFHDKQSDYPEVFRIMPYERFIQHWQPRSTATAWDRLQDSPF